MRADAVPALSQVAVGAENLEAGRVLVVPEPTVDSRAGIEAFLCPVLGPVVVDMVDGKESALSFAAACAGAAIGIEGGRLYGSAPFAVSCQVFGAIARMPVGVVGAFAGSAVAVFSVLVASTSGEGTSWFGLRTSFALFHSTSIITRN